jgi:hypothetical protein
VRMIPFGREKGTETQRGQLKFSHRVHHSLRRMLHQYIPPHRLLPTTYLNRYLAKSPSQSLHAVLQYSMQAQCHSPTHHCNPVASPPDLARSHRNLIFVPKRPYSHTLRHSAPSPWRPARGPPVLAREAQDPAVWTVRRGARCARHAL